MDPFVFIFPEIHDSIFRHFSVRELKNLTLVCKSWNERIINSRNLNRFVFSVYQKFQAELDSTLKILLTSERKYKNVTINLNNFSFNDSCDDCPPLAFESVCYSYGILPKSISPIICIQDRVKVLQLTKMICESEEINFDLKFSKLEKLTLFKNYGNVNLIFKNCESLKFLCFTQRNNSDCNELLATLLKNNKSLENLRLNLKDGEAVKEIMKDCKFKLKHLIFNSDDELSEELKKTLLEIIQTQLNSLSDISINRWCGVNVLQNIFSIKNLKFLSLNVDHGQENVYDIFLPVNLSLTHLNIDEMKSDSFLLQKIIKSVPNLIFYKTILMQHEDMIEIEKKCKILQELYVENFYVENIPNFFFFKNLKAFKTMDIDDNLLKALRSKECQDRGHFENLVFESYFRI